MAALLAGVAAIHGRLAFDSPAIEEQLGDQGRRIGEVTGGDRITIDVAAASDAHGLEGLAIAQVSVGLEDARRACTGARGSGA